MEERRLLVALALSILVMTAWSHFFGAKGPAPHPSPAAVSQTAAEPAPSPQDATSSGVAAPEKIAASAGPAVAAEAEVRVEAITPAATLAFNNKGASLISWQLTRYPNALGRGEEMVRPGRNGVRPLDLETGDADVDARLREALFRPSAETVTVSRDGEGELVFNWAAGGLEAEKRLRFLPGGDLVQVSAVVKRDGRLLPVKVLFGPGLGTATKEEKGVTGYLPPQGIVLAASGESAFPPPSSRRPARSPA